jgi:hypothetical protein
LERKLLIFGDTLIIGFEHDGILYKPYVKNQTKNNEISQLAYPGYFMEGKQKGTS